MNNKIKIKITGQVVVCVSDIVMGAPWGSLDSYGLSLLREASLNRTLKGSSKMTKNLLGCLECRK